MIIKCLAKRGKRLKIRCFISAFTFDYKTIITRGTNKSTQKLKEQTHILPHL